MSSGDDAWREAEFTRDIWYANLLHFAADIAAPSELIEWVAQHRRLDLGRVVPDNRRAGAIPLRGRPAWSADAPRGVGQRPNRQFCAHRLTRCEEHRDGR